MSYICYFHQFLIIPNSRGRMAQLTAPKNELILTISSHSLYIKKKNYSFTLFNIIAGY